MKTSNTKLTKAQKQELKEFKKLNPSYIFTHHPSEGLTLLFVPENTAKVRVHSALCSPDEQKYRRKVGEYTAMNRMDWEGGLLLPQPFNVQELADSIAQELPNIT
jgi:hypothetical protein